MTEVAIIGTVRTTVLANLRVGAPDTQAPVGQKFPAGTTLSVAAVAAGEAVQGNPLWFRSSDQNYIWSGACGPLQVAGVVATPGAPAVSAGAPTPIVVDLSHGDRVENLQAARAAGLVGVIHKATTGATGRDDAYAARRQAALEAGLLWGAYHWGTAADITAQVDNFLGWAAADQKQWGDADAGVL